MLSFFGRGPDRGILSKKGHGMAGQWAWRAFATSAVALVAAAILVAGCGQQAQSKKQQESRLKPLSLLYGQYMGQHRGQPPQNEAEFKKFVETQKSFLTQFGITDPATLFISERDGQPYVVIYGKPAGPALLAGQPVIAYEKVGVGGKRFVASQLGAVEEVDEARFKELVPGG